MWPDLICSVVSTGPKPSGQKIAPLKEKDGSNCGMGGGCVYFSKAVLAVGNIIIKQDALLWSWSLNGETMMRSNSWMISFNVYVWSLKMYRSSSLKSEHVWKVPNTACFKDRLHLQYLFKVFFRWLKNLRWKITLGICVRLFLPFQASQANLKQVIFSCWQLFCSTWTNGMFILPSYFFGYHPIFPFPEAFVQKENSWILLGGSSQLVSA